MQWGPCVADNSFGRKLEKKCVNTCPYYFCTESESLQLCDSLLCCGGRSLLRTNSLLIYAGDRCVCHGGKDIIAPIAQIWSIIDFIWYCMYKLYTCTIHTSLFPPSRSLITPIEVHLVQAQIRKPKSKYTSDKRHQKWSCIHNGVRREKTCLPARTYEERKTQWGQVLA